MIKASASQRKQIDIFFRLITEDFDKILLHPIIDKDGVERLSISIVDDNDVYIFGVLFLEEDPLVHQFEFKVDKLPILAEQPGFSLWRNITKMLKRDKSFLFRKE